MLFAVDQGNMPQGDFMSLFGDLNADKQGNDEGNAGFIFNFDGSQGAEPSSSKNIFDF